MLGLAFAITTIHPHSLLYAGNETPPRTITLQKTGTRTKPYKPKAPDRQIVTCAYDGDELHFSFVIPEGNATLTMTDERQYSVTYEFDTTPLVVDVPVGNLPGITYLEIETESGNSYSGILE